MWYPGIDEKTFMHLQDSELSRQVHKARGGISGSVGTTGPINDGAGKARIWTFFRRLRSSILAKMSHGAPQVGSVMRRGE